MGNIFSLLCLMKIIFRDLTKILIGQIRCSFCSTPDKDSFKYGICRHCRILAEKELVKNISKNQCHQCGQPLLSEFEICMECRKVDFQLKNQTLFVYNGIGQDLIYFYKFEKYRRLADYFAFLFNQHLKRMNFKDYVLVPVPPSPDKIKKKGWDQIDLILKIMKKKYNWTVITPLGKAKGGSVQKLLNRQERLENNSGRFYIKKKENLPEKILLIDDVITTGSTLNECYQTLIQGGAKKVKSLTIARDF
jgi:competence protein ComFC